MANNDMDSEERDFLHGLGLAGIVLVSAALTATLVVAAGSGYVDTLQTGAAPPLLSAPPAP